MDVLLASGQDVQDAYTTRFGANSFRTYGWRSPSLWFPLGLETGMVEVRARQRGRNDPHYKAGMDEETCVAAGKFWWRKRCLAWSWRWGFGRGSWWSGEGAYGGRLPNSNFGPQLEQGD